MTMQRNLADPVGWFAKVDLDLTGVTSTNMDKDNLQIECNATLEASAIGVERKSTADVTYKVMTDLSSGKVMVLANLSSGSNAITEMARLVGEPEIAEPRQKRAAASKARGDAMVAVERARGEAYYRDHTMGSLQNDNATTSPVPNKSSDLQIPCTTVGHTEENACIVFYEYVSGNTSNTQSLIINPLVARFLEDKAKSISIIYDVRVAPNGKNPKGTIKVYFNDDWLSADIFIDEPTYFWVTTQDSGKNWSKIATSQSDAITN